VRSMFIFLSYRIEIGSPVQAGEQAQRQRRGRTRCPWKHYRPIVKWAP
jgi:hypothetical protein